MVYPTSANIDCLLRRFSCMPITSHPSFPEADITSHALPTPCFPSTAIIHTLCEASCRLVLARLISACFCARRRSILPRRLFLRARNFLCLVIFSTYSFFPFPLFPFSPDLLVSRARFSPAGPRRPTFSPCLVQILCLLTVSTPSLLRFPRRLPIFSYTLAVGMNGSA